MDLVRWLNEQVDGQKGADDHKKAADELRVKYAKDPSSAKVKLSKSLGLKPRVS